MTQTGNYWYVNLSTEQLKQSIDTQTWYLNSENPKYLQYLEQIKGGDRIVAKSAYSRKNNLPFDASNQHVGVMAIYAIGTIKSEVQENQLVEVGWDELFEQPKEWYFFTYRDVISKISPTDQYKQALIDFTFNHQKQDYQLFLNHPYWSAKYKQIGTYADQLKWMDFYQNFASYLLRFKNRRAELIAKIKEIAQRYSLSYILGKDLNDICPFTVMGVFNRSIVDSSRTAIATELAQFLGLDQVAPIGFDAIPLLNNQMSWFFGFNEKRQTEDINNLWEFFEFAIQYADQDKPEDLDEKFADLYLKVSSQHCVGWNLSMGLFWIRPWHYLTLDTLSQNYIKHNLGLSISTKGPKRRCSGWDYLALMDEVEAKFKFEQSDVRSFAELSLVAWLQDQGRHIQSNDNDIDLKELEESKQNTDVLKQEILDEKYNLDHVIAEGCFLAPLELESIFRRLKEKKNLILQGPTGTGKTWLAKRLGYALIGTKSKLHLKSVQFHPNTSYEDFIRGWRPALNPITKQSELTLVDGPFLKLVEQAKASPNERFVLVIEEINRGHPAQIFGEMLTLLECTKRHESEAMALSYSRESERVYIPENLYVIGTMNIADRSLATLDLALRRRFAFINLKPMFDERWVQWCSQHVGLSRIILEQIQKRIMELNHDIEHDTTLGKQFCIGHSFFTPASHLQIQDVQIWYKEVIDTEILPLLEEYWFDQPEKITEQYERLLGT